MDRSCEVRATILYGVWTSPSQSKDKKIYKKEKRAGKEFIGGNKVSGRTSASTYGQVKKN